MKINIIVPFTVLTGGIKVIFQYANSWIDSGHDVVVYAPLKVYKLNRKGIKGDLKAVIRSNLNYIKHIVMKKGVDWFPCRFHVKWVPNISDKYIRDGDCVIATAWPTAYDVYNLNNSKGSKVYFVQHYETWSGEKECVDGSYKLDMKKITIANWLKDLMENKFHDKNTDVVYNGIDTKEFYLENKKSDKVDYLMLLYHPEEWKGYNEGVKVFKTLKLKYPHLKLLVFGSDNCNDLPEDSEFFLSPSREVLRGLYNKADLFLFTSKFEGWGLTPLEAMACMCPVVGSDTGCIKECFEDGVNVMKADPQNIAAFSNKAEKLILDNALRTRIAENAFEIIQTFSIEKSAERFLEIMKNP